MKVKYTCNSCEKIIWWELSLWKRIERLFKNKKHKKLCKDCYEKWIR